MLIRKSAPEAIKDAYKDGQNLYYVSLHEGYEMHTP